MMSSVQNQRRVAPLDTGAPLAIITVTYNSAEVLPGLLDSLQAGSEGLARVQVIVVDNASQDSSVAVATAHPIRPLVVKTGRNGGYSAGINAGMADLPADANVLVLNPDIRLFPGAARLLVQRLEQAKVGIAVPRVLEQDGSVSTSLRREPSLVTAWAEALLGGALATRLGISEILGPPLGEGQSFDWASGAVIAIAARARRAVGAWDESYFLYSEEVDYQRRVRESGLSIDYVPEAEVVHIGGEYHANPRLYGILTANRVRYFRRYHSPVATALFRAGIIAGEAIRCVKGSAVHKAGLAAALRRWTPPVSAANGLSDA
ncbi:MAG TPA: glycosyltransferase [Arsenicitalea sp.]|nr:glycosyltransferase [Arsenicitalea sp.]